jgi:hypothetical protein
VLRTHAVFYARIRRNRRSALAVGLLLAGLAWPTGCGRDEKPDTAPMPGRGWVATARPADGAGGVSVETTRWRIVFDRPMGTSSWTYWIPPAKAGTIPPIANPDANPWISPTVCEIRLGQLQPDTQYAIQLNSRSDQGFRSAAGKQPMPPALLRFRTSPVTTVYPGGNRPLENSGQPRFPKPPTPRTRPARNSGAPRVPPLPPTADTDQPVEKQLIGTWSYHGPEQQINLTVKPDGKASYVIYTSGGQEIYAGTLRRAGKQLRLRTDTGGLLTFQLETIAPTQLRLSDEKGQKTFQRRRFPSKPDSR